MGSLLDLLVLPSQLGPHQHRVTAVIYDRPWIAMNAAHVRAEAAISTRNGLTVDFADFAIAALRWCQVRL